MKTLSEILALKEEILNLVAAFGFQTEDVKIYKDNLGETKGNSLYILVKKAPNKSISYKNASLLEAVLVDELQCDVTVENYNTIDELSRDHYDINCRSLFDTPGLCQLFGVTSPDKIIFSNFDDSDDYLKLQPKVLKHAREFLKENNAVEKILEKKNNQSNTFWPKESDPQPSSADGKSLEEEILAYLMANTKLWHQLEQSPQELDGVLNVIKQTVLQGTARLKGLS